MYVNTYTHIHSIHTQTDVYACIYILTQAGTHTYIHNFVHMNLSAFAMTSVSHDGENLRNVSFLGIYKTIMREGYIVICRTARKVECLCFLTYPPSSTDNGVRYGSDVGCDGARFFRFTAKCRVAAEILSV